MDPLNAFTVDVEDYYHVSAFESTIRRGEWDRWESRVEANTRRLLALLERHGVRATFYVLGWVARRRPQLVRAIDRAGHEIGAHGYWHRLIYRQTPDEFRRDLRSARDVLADLVGRPVTAYRAPSFSITARSRWALEILVEEGFRCDSSVFPVRHDRYGMPGAAAGIHRLATPRGELIEFPPTAVRLGPLKLPVGGGGYFRLYPFAWTRRCLRRVLDRERRPFMFYVHPWEIDPGQPRAPAPSPLARFRHYVHLDTTEQKLDRLLRTFRFGAVADVLRRELGDDAEQPRTPCTSPALARSST